MPPIPPPPPQTTGTGRAAAHAGVVVSVGIGITLLISLVSARVPQVAIFVVAPVVVAALVGATCVAVWCLRRVTLSATATIGASTLGGLAGTCIGILGSAWIRGLSTQELLGSPLLQQGLPAGAILGAIVGSALLLLARVHQRELGLAMRATALEAARLRLEKDQVLGELKVLQAQVEPHFLYNTLANLRYLIRTDAGAAATMLEHLIRYFKGTVPTLRGQGTALGTELDLCESYIDIMRIRTAKALQFEVTTTPELEGAAIPPCLLLTLVENAIKHGTPANRDTPIIRIETAHIGPSLVVRVIDNGPGPTDRPRTDGGVGLSNVRARLSRLFSDSARLELITLKPSGCEARLELPYSEALAWGPEGADGTTSMEPTRP